MIPSVKNMHLHEQQRDIIVLLGILRSIIQRWHWKAVPKKRKKKPICVMGNCLLINVYRMSESFLAIEVCVVNCTRCFSWERLDYYENHDINGIVDALWWDLITFNGQITVSIIRIWLQLQNCCLSIICFDGNIAVMREHTWWLHNTQHFCCTLH